MDIFYELTKIECKYENIIIYIYYIFLSFKESAGYAGSQNSARLLEVYQPYFLKHTNEEDISIVLPKIIEIIDSLNRLLKSNYSANR